MRLGRIGGCRLKISWPLIPILALAALSGLINELVLVFLVVLLHEICHCIMAAIFGFPVTEIEILPFGSVARIEGMFSANPRAEAAIALAGPLANLLLLMMLITTDYYYPINFPLKERFLAINAGLAVFNLLPGLPLDGGRVVRSLLSSSLGLGKATSLAAISGILIGTILVCYSIYTLLQQQFNLLLGICGAYLLFCAIKEKREASWLMLREITGKKNRLLGAEVMQVRQIVIPENLELGRLVKRFLPNRYHLILIVDNAFTPVGSVSESQVVNGIFKYGASTTVKELLNKREVDRLQ